MRSMLRTNRFHSAMSKVSLAEKEAAQADDLILIPHQPTLYGIVLGAGDLVEAILIALPGVVPDALVGEEGGQQGDDEHQIRRPVAANMLRPRLLRLFSVNPNRVPLL